ncbi:LD-carboxypeptidase [Sphingorhabdus sp. YGSMI21]|uniref:LD-carboxypeptidase n=1 Tax=Sphingorhabdus sp. YGSMI21 TaxID=2077182 RepID=UPI000C1F743E|nr:LD-carboxypeptidase [Sphingorhabdus sp. YGSMI21]ATW05550.1 LD-carboxypeptidase [Sphingorhabdus sp. YGSMI21]
MAQGTNSISPSVRIGICAPSTPFTRDAARRVMALAARTHPQAELVFAEQCFSEQGHFAGSDTQRTDSFVSLANDPDIDAIWFARGGYGAARIAEAAVQRLNDVAHRKIYLGYSDAGNLLGALYRAGIGQVAHGPMPSDIGRTGGEEAVVRSLDWIVHRLADALEPGLVSGQKYAAFNLMTLAMMTGTKLIPDLHDHILIIEEISEYLYAFDRAMFHLCSNLAGQGLAGIRLGGVDDIPENDRPFGESAEAIVQRWAGENAIAYLGRAEIGHHAQNRIVPFGLLPI